ncbi:MAG TPA: hypothetical protein VM261_08220 [Kofleriaceae bacterium]|nr:hypothetical protein [Kofleriaceae bacterium]
MRGSHCVAFALALAGCSSAAGSSPQLVPDIVENRPSPRSCKPEAPVAVTLSTTVIDARQTAVVATATPTTDLEALELALVLPPELALTAGPAKLRWGAVAAGEARVLRATVRLDGRSAELAVAARVPVDGITMARTAVTRLGAPLAPAVTRTYALPDGEMAREVRP